MIKSMAETPSDRLHKQLKTLQAQVVEPEAVFRKQVVEAIGGLRESLQELDAAEAELAQQNEALLAAREALEVERHRYLELFDLAPVPYLVTDDRGMIEEANRAASTLFNTPRQLLEGKPLPSLIAPADRLRFRSFLQQLRESLDLREAEMGLDDRGLGPRTVLLSAERDAHRPKRRAPVRLRWVLRDITDHKAAEEELRASQERLRHGQRLEAIGRLAGGVAHSFNNLLAAISFHAELLLDAEGSPENHRRHAEEIQNAGERAALLARQLLAFSHKEVLQPQPLDVGRRLGDLAPILRRLIGEQIELTTELAPGACWVHADLGQLEQVILNLVVNARDAMPGGGRLSLASGCVDLSGSEPGLGLARGSYVRITVSDTGTGMDDHVRAHLFEPFFTTKSRDKGTGLGLSTVYGIVQQSGGAIQVASKPGQGSTFIIHLPRAAAPVEMPSEAPPLEEEVRGSEVVLLAEDEDNIRHPAQEILEARGYTVLPARDATQALDLANRWGGPIHLLISDVIMPGMSGSQLASRLAAERPGLQILYISGYPEDAIAQHGVLRPGRSFLQKPFPPGVLLRKVREILDREGRCEAAM